MWWWQRPASYVRWVRQPVRSRRRCLFVYRRQWATAMEACGLTDRRDGSVFVPPLLKVRSTASVDRVPVRMLAGQTFEQFAAVGPALAQTFGAHTCRARTIRGRVHDLELWLLVVDPLTATVDPLPTEDDALTVGLPVARAEDGSVWRMMLLGFHILIVGATEAGKGSVIWSILHHLVPAIRAGLVKVWAIDPKGGIELGPGRGLFDRFCYGDADTGTDYEAGFAELLEEAVAVMRRRLDRMRGHSRLHQPSVDEPLMVVVIDEIAALTGWISSRTVKNRIETALGLLLSQGRAAGVVVIGAVQDTRNDVLPMRDLFPTRIALRMNESEQVTLALGNGARNRGALCDHIPPSLPGVGYVQVDGIPEPVRVRFSYLDDQAIRALTATPRPELQLVTQQPAIDVEAA